MADSERKSGSSAQRAARLAATRAAERKRRQRLVVGGSALAVLAVAAAAFAVTRGGDDASDTLAAAPSASPQASPEAASVPATAPAGTAAASGACSYPASVGEPAARPVQPPPASPVASGLAATMVTDRGTVAFDLLEAAPCTVNSLRSLAAAKYFDGTPCHRLTTSGLFVLQCGDPTGQGNGGPGYQFADENLTGATYPRGTVAMANAGPGTNGSQFFLVYKDSQLPPLYTPFGRITAGLDALDKIAAGGTDGDGPPNPPVTVQTLRVAPA